MDPVPRYIPNLTIGYIPRSFLLPLRIAFGNPPFLDPNHHLVELILVLISIDTHQSINSFIHLPLFSSALVSFSPESSER